MATTYHKMPTGAKHAPCTTHVPHAYPSNGWLCIDDEPGRAEDMRAFADHLVAAAAEHHTLELERSAARPADGSHARWEIPIDYQNGAPVVQPVCRKANTAFCGSSYPIHLHGMGGPAPERSAEDRAAVARMSAELYARKQNGARSRALTAPDSAGIRYIAAGPLETATADNAGAGTYCTGPASPGYIVDPAPVVAPVKVRKASPAIRASRRRELDRIGILRPVLRADVVDLTVAQAPEPVQNVQPEPERSAGHLGYTWTLEGGLCEVYTVGSSVCRAPLSRPVMTDGRRAGREWWPVSYASMYETDTYATVDLAAAAMAASGPIASADAPAPVLDVVAEPCAHDYQPTVRGQDWYPGLACVICGAPYDYGYQLARDISATTYVDGIPVSGPLAPVQPAGAPVARTGRDCSVDYRRGDCTPAAACRMHAVGAPVVAEPEAVAVIVSGTTVAEYRHVDIVPAPVLDAPAPIAEPEPVAPVLDAPVEAWNACAVTIGSSQCTAGTTGHPGPHAVYVHHEPVVELEAIDEPVQPCLYTVGDEACDAGPIGHKGAHHYPTVQPCYFYLHTNGVPPIRCNAGLDGHDGAHRYPDTAPEPAPAVLAPVVEPEAVQPAPAVLDVPAGLILAPYQWIRPDIGTPEQRAEVEAQYRAEQIAAYLALAPAPAVLAPVLTVVQPSSRPTCARCGQTFRQSGAGAEWHRVKRPDCAAGARSAVLAAV